MRRMVATVVGAVCAMSFAAAPAGAVSGWALTYTDWRCGSVIVGHGPAVIDRDNTGEDEERLGYFVVDANGVAVGSITTAFPLGQEIDEGDSQVLFFVEPTKNPLTLSLVSVAGNGLPEQVIWTTSGDSPCLDPSAPVEPPTPPMPPAGPGGDTAPADVVAAAPRFTG